MEFETSGEIPGSYLNKVFSVGQEAYEIPELRLQMALIIRLGALNVDMIPDQKKPIMAICAVLEKLKLTALSN